MREIDEQMENQTEKKKRKLSSTRVLFKRLKSEIRIPNKHFTLTNHARVYKTSRAPIWTSPTGVSTAR